MKKTDIVSIIVLVIITLLLLLTFAVRVVEAKTLQFEEELFCAGLNQIRDHLKLPTVKCGPGEALAALLRTDMLPGCTAIRSDNWFVWAGATTASQAGTLLGCSPVSAATVPQAILTAEELYPPVIQPRSGLFDISLSAVSVAAGICTTSPESDLLPRPNVKVIPRKIRIIIMKSQRRASKEAMVR
jgi:hypothetical protein